jgi:glutathione S-transferase
MKLYDFPFSPNCRKVRAVAYELGIELVTSRVDILKGEQRAPAFLAKNPNAKVPVLEDGDFILWESTAIMRYLAAKSSSPLLPTDPRAGAEVDRWLSWGLAHLQPAIGKVAFERVVKKLANRGAPDDAVVAAGTADFATFAAVLETSLAGKEYVAGRLSLADFALAAPLSLVDLCGLDVAPYPQLRGWLSRVLARESMKRALADAQV